jgi:hypothetical protein
MPAITVTVVTTTSGIVQTPVGPVTEPVQSSTTTQTFSLDSANAAAAMALFPGLAGASAGGVNLATATAAQLAAGVPLATLSAALQLAIAALTPAG